MVSNLTLYECLQQVSLEKYHGKFKDRGILDVGGLLSLTMQDYPTLGISSMADRQNLFYLIQTIKALQPSSQERQLRSGTRNDGLLQLEDSAVKAKGIKRKPFPLRRGEGEGEGRPQALILSSLEALLGGSVCPLSEFQTFTCPNFRKAACRCRNFV